MAKWLQKRLKFLKLTHEQFGKRLAELGIERSRVTITNWVNGDNVNLLGNPEDVKRLATALDWSVTELLLAAGYEIGESHLNIPPELIPQIKFYNKLPKRQQERYLESISFVAKMLRGVMNIDDDDDLREEL